jgi:hypothetical protein
MSADDPHLSLRSLASIEGIEKIFTDLARDLYHASFGRGELGIEKCIDEHLRIAILPLFAALGFEIEVRLPVRC